MSLNINIKLSETFHKYFPEWDIDYIGYAYPGDYVLLSEQTNQNIIGIWCIVQQVTDGSPLLKNPLNVVLKPRIIEVEDVSELFKLFAEQVKTFKDYGLRVKLKSRLGYNDVIDEIKYPTFTTSFKGSYHFIDKIITDPDNHKDWFPVYKQVGYKLKG
jgi:hypothetical protein